MRLRHPRLKEADWVCEAFRAPHYITLACGHPGGRPVILRDSCGDGVRRTMDVAGIQITTDCE